MSTKLLYYNVFLCKNDMKTDYPIEKILDYLMIKLNSEQRYKELSKESYAMTQMRIPNEEKEGRNRTIWVGKYREKKPFQGKKRTDVVEPIKGDVFEPSTCLFIPSSNLMVMEYNHVGCKYKGLSEYLNSFLVNNNGWDKKKPKWSIEIEPIKTKKTFDLLKSSNRIKSVEIKFLTEESYLPELVKHDAKEKKMIEELLEGPIDIAKKIDSSVTTVSLSQSKYKRKMDVNILTTILAGIEMKSPGIISAKISFINSATGKPDFIDLKHDGLLQDEILDGDNSNGFDFLALKISEYYYGLGNRPGQTTQYNYKLVHDDSNIEEIMK